MSKKDADGNIVGCSYCGARDIKKDGWEYKTKLVKKQLYYLNRKEL